jgi:hypothetical protein
MRRSALGCAAFVALEVLGVLSLFAPFPLAWMWIGSLAYRATGSITVDLALALLGFLGSAWAVIWWLSRVDERWISRRRSLGHEQRDGALTRVVITAMAIALPVAYLWFNLSGAVVIKFMPH